MSREDILADATAFIDRAEYSFEWFTDDTVIAGFRKQGALSMFFGEAEVYHFNVARELRRGYWQDRLLKAENGQLVELSRQRTPAQSVLERRRLDMADQDAHLQRLERRLDHLRHSLDVDQFQVLREVSVSETGVTDRLRNWLHDSNRIRVANRPNVS